MKRPRLRPFSATPTAVTAALDALRERHAIPADFPAEAQAEAEQAAQAWEKGGPARYLADGTRDARDLPLVTIDPPGSMDLDQAVLLTRLDPPSEAGTVGGATAGEGEPGDAPGAVHKGSAADGDPASTTPPAPSARYRVHYAIASLATFVTPGGALDAELWRRGETVYAPDHATPLHPEVLSHGAASLLPDADRPSCLWTIDLDATGEVVTAHVERALVRSRARLTYAQVQSAVDGQAELGPEVPDDLAELLAEIGRLREEREAARGGVSLRTPEQEIEETGGTDDGRTGDGGSAGGYRLVFRANLDVEEWNAQISLLTGMCAAQIMLKAGVGILRTMPPAGPDDLARMHRVARALGVDWPDGTNYPDLVRSLDSAIPAHAAFMEQAAGLFRGADYLAFGVPAVGAAADGAAAGGETRGTRRDDRATDNGNPTDDHATSRETRGRNLAGDAASDERPEVAAPGPPIPVPTGQAALHGAIAAPYAHVTAPLRRLVDRYGEEICVATCAGAPVPDWVRQALPGLPGVMAATGKIGRSVANGALAAMEALVLAGHEGQVFEGVITSVRKGQGEVILAEPAVVGVVKANGNGDQGDNGAGGQAAGTTERTNGGHERLPVGERVRVRLIEADPAAARVRFELA